MNVNLFSFIIISVLSGCASNPLDPSKNYESNRLKIISSLSYDTNSPSLTKKILLVGDNQINENHGLPLFIQSNLADLKEKVALRPVQQTLFGEEILRQVLKSEQVPIIHLGDAINLSCKSEYNQFVKLMNESNREWVIALGNHDGFFTGITLGTKDIKEHAQLNLLDEDYGRDRHAWNAACDGSEPLSKPNFVKDYLELLRVNYGVKLSKINSKQNCTRNFYHSGFIDESFSCIFPDRTRGDRPWASFIVQKIDISNPKEILEKVSLILLDTSVYESSPRFIYGGAGEEGGLGQTQKEILNEWLYANKKEGILTILAGHHPIHQLLENDISFLSEHSKNSNFLFYISAHTHKGAIYTHNKGTQEEIAEINLGSIYDSPIEYRYLDVYRENSDQRRLVIHTPLLRANDPDSLFDNLCKNVVLPEKNDPHSLEKQAFVEQEYGPYTAQLIRIRAELNVYSDILSKFPSPSSESSQFERHNSEIKDLLEKVKYQQKEAKKCFLAFDKLECEKKKRIRETVRTEVLPKLRDISNWIKTRDVSDKEAYKAYKACQAKLASEEDALNKNSLWNILLRGGKNTIQ